MHIRHWLRSLLAALVWAAFLAAPGLPLPAADRLGLGGSAAAQESIDIDTFYDELAPYGQWVWHPRFGYVWLPETISENWRPYTVGRWTYTDEYGWYWDSHEPFAWAVYHYGRWGYDPDYGWFWVPGDTWAPAWVQWRYSDDYVGWAPIGPGRPGYAYGVPVNYDPPIAESWVFVQPRYLTSRAISHYALPIGGLSVAFFGATRAYRPQYRGGIVYNYGMPRDLVVKITRRPIYVQKVYRVNNWKGGRFDNNGPNKGIGIYAPRFSKDNRPNRGPKKFADNPNDFRPKAKLKDTFKGDVPKGWGPSAKGVKSIAKEDPDAFKKKHGFGGQGDQFGDRGKDKDHDKDKGQASKDFDRDGRDGKKDGGPPAPKLPPPVVKGGTGDQSKEKFEATGDRDGHGKDKDKDKDKDKSKGQASKDFDRDGKQGRKDNKNNSFDVRTQTESGTLRQDDNKDNAKNKNKNQNFGNQGGSDQFKQGKRDDNEGGGNKNKNKNFGAPGGPGGPGQFKQGSGGAGGQGGVNQFKQDGGQGQAQGNQGGGGGGGGDKKCQKHPEKPECQGRN